MECYGTEWIGYYVDTTCMFGKILFYQVQFHIRIVNVEKIRVKQDLSLKC